MPRRALGRFVGLLSLSLLAGMAAGQGNSGAAEPETAEQIARELANPLAPVTTLSANLRSEFGWGPNNDTNSLLRLQPSFFKPLAGTSAFLLRTIAPLKFNRFPERANGLGDITLVPYYVPDITRNVFVGVGGALILPTATDDTLGSDRWSAGPAVIAAKTGDPLTVGGLVQHVWSFAGDSDRADVNATTLQPFATFLLGGGWSATLTSEATYNWDADSGQRWTIPLTVAAAKVINVGSKYLNVGLAYVEYLEGPDFGPDRELRLSATYVVR